MGLVRLTGNGPDQLAARAVAQRDLIFKDDSDGGVRVVDGKTGTTLTVLQGEQGFVRGALRALARERFARGIGSDQPFELIARADGRLTLNDPAQASGLIWSRLGHRTPENSVGFWTWRRCNRRLMT